MTMCRIFELAMTCEASREDKIKTAEMFVQESSKSRPSCEAGQMLQMTMRFILHSRDDLTVELSLKVFDAWNKGENLNSFFGPGVLSMLMDDEAENPLNIIILLQRCMGSLRSLGSIKYASFCTIIRNKSSDFVRRHDSWEVLTRFCSFLLEFPECIPKKLQAYEFCRSLIESLCKVQTPSVTDKLCSYITDIPHVVGSLFQWIVKDDKSGSLLQDFINKIFDIISTPPNGEVQFLALGAIVQFLPNELMTSSIQTVTAASLVPIDTLVNALDRMIDWLGWPLIKNMNNWVIFFLENLREAEKYEVLIQIAEKKIQAIYEKVKNPLFRHQHFNVFSYLLAGYQHSPKCFHQIVRDIPVFLRSVKEEENSFAFVENFSGVLLCLMSLHKGYPELYQPILDLLEEIKSPEEEIQEMFRRKIWNVRASEYHNKSVDLWKESDNKAAAGLDDLSTTPFNKLIAGKTGLLNMQNSCYLNSVIQTLLMCDSFRIEMCRLDFPPNRVVLNVLQRLFAYMQYTTRPSLAAVELRIKAAPKHFGPGEQQDASEFLGFLIDTLMEEEKPVFGDEIGWTAVSNNFYGKISSTSQCLICKSESNQIIPYAELSLMFPSSGSGQCSMSGGKQCSSVGISEASMVNVSSDAVLLDDMISKLFETEKFEGDNQYYCDSCARFQDGERRSVIVETANFLLLTLNRFSYTNMMSRKILTKVDIPRTIVLPVLRGESIEKDVFCLVAVIVHCGSTPHSGHYLCLARHQKLLPKSQQTLKSASNEHQDFFIDKWYLFDDETITISSLEIVTNSSTGRTPYILFYRKITDSLLSKPDEGGDDYAGIAKYFHQIRIDNSNYLENQNKQNKSHKPKIWTPTASSSKWKKDRGDEDEDYPGPSNNQGFLHGPREVY